MKFLTSFLLVFGLIITLNAQDKKILLADGTNNEPKKEVSQPNIKKLSANEIKNVKKFALEKEVEFNPNYFQMSSEESNFKQDFQLLDVCEGFFVNREIKSRAYLYTAYSKKMTRNYQGILVLSKDKKTKTFAVVAHYAYEYRGDTNIRKLSDINENSLSEIAIFSEPPTKKDFRRYIRIIEFSIDNIEKLGMKKIYSSIPQKQLDPISVNGETTKRVYRPPIVSAIKLYSIKDKNKPIEFYEERWTKTNDFWGLREKLLLAPTELEEDKINYLEIVKPRFSKCP